ncbi:MAG: Phosphatidylinositol 3,5-bisphosphate-binding protein [Bogoriella megaspora]|nr:MAG: Phosphatidylinositol 3,5-bisphosphate-binding protein [Bogoriella megaspora]
MNTRQAIGESKPPPVFSASFNDDTTFFSVGLEDGFRVYNARTCDCAGGQDEMNGGIGYAEMVERTNYLALVGGGPQPKYPQNKVIIWDNKKKSKVLGLEFRTAIQRVRLTRTHIVVVLLNSVNLYTFAPVPTKLGTFETTTNPFGLCALGKQLMVFPGRTPGHVQVVSLSTRSVSIIPAHSSPLRALTLGRDERLCATASEKGTLLRVWQTSNCARLIELRRGADPAAIFCLAISPNSSFLAVTSDKSTLHIFDLPPTSSSRDASTFSSSSPQDAPNWELLSSSPSSSSSTTISTAPNTKKYGILSTLPLMPRLVTDTYSFASTSFTIGDEPSPGPASSAPIPGVPGGKPPKGVIGWLSEDRLVVVEAGWDARWEMFVLGRDSEGRRGVGREGWRRYIEE